jgi:farnesyl diphosphate synthase
MISIENKLSLTAKEIHNKLDLILPKNDEDLFNAIRYSSISNGKCIRGFLAIEFYKLFDADIEKSIILACIIELIHAFSLVHDDLPALDNSDTRRGKESCHKKFSESTAILTGDAILVLSYNLLGKHYPNIVSFASEYIMEMINGQIYDLNNRIEKIQINRMKTGSMFALSCACGAYLNNADPSIINNMSEFGYHFGILFQFADDIEDDGRSHSDQSIQDSLKYIKNFLNLDIFQPVRDTIEQLLDYMLFPYFPPKLLKSNLS